MSEWIDTQFEEPARVEFVKLENIGDSVEGVFVGVEERKNSFGKTEMHIQIKTGEDIDGNVIIGSLRANQRLLAQVAPVSRGMMIRVEHTEDRPNDGVDREGRPLSPTKLYRVQSRKATAPASRQSASKSKDDIPF